jgi:CRP-like cAMP-binding protein
VSIELTDPDRGPPEQRDPWREDVGSPVLGSSLPSEALRVAETVRPGGIFGTTDYFLRRRRTMNARCHGPCVVYALTRDALSRLQMSNPQLFSQVSDALARSMSMTIDTANSL